MQNYYLRTFKRYKKKKMGIYSICGFILVALLLLMVFNGRYANSARKRVISEEETGQEPQKVSDGECCGKHLVCEKQKIADQIARGALYFEDEDLDQYIGRASDDYDDQETEEFRYVLYTLRENEIQDWLGSLVARGVELPDQLKEEAYSLVNELG